MEVGDSPALQPIAHGVPSSTAPPPTRSTRESASQPEAVSHHANLDAMQSMRMDMRRLPGAELVEKGLSDLERRDESVEALLVSIGAPRLRSIGLAVPPAIPTPEHRLYMLLAESKGDGAHSAYNSLIRRLVSFERTAACAS